jgi:general secretion pathway protein I
VKSKGFTLLETLIALVILAGGLTLLVTSWSGSFMRLRKTQFNYEMALLLEKKIGELEFEYRGRPVASIPDEQDGDFGSDYPNYSWKMSSKKMDFPDLSQALASQSGKTDQITSMLMKQLITLFNQSVKEVTVTVIFQDGNRKPVEQSVTTLFVDYNAVSGLKSDGTNNPSSRNTDPRVKQ